MFLTIKTEENVRELDNHGFLRRAGEHVAGLKRNRHVPDGKRVYGMYKGVRVGIIRTNGKIATVFPDSIQPVKRRRKKK